MLSGDPALGPQLARDAAGAAETVLTLLLPGITSGSAQSQSAQS